MSDEIEEWRDVVEYEGLYMVSNLGRVESLGRLVPYKKTGKKTFRKGRFLSQNPDSDGYPSVALFKNGKRTDFLTHVFGLHSFSRSKT